MYLPVSLHGAEIQIKRSSTSVTSLAVEKSMARRPTLEPIFAGTQENVLLSAVGLFVANDLLVQMSCSATREHTQVRWIQFSRNSKACLILFDYLILDPWCAYFPTGSAEYNGIVAITFILLITFFQIFISPQLLYVSLFKSVVSSLESKEQLGTRA